MQIKLAKELLIELSETLTYSRIDSVKTVSQLQAELQQPLQALAKYTREMKVLQGEVDLQDYRSNNAMKPSGQFATHTITITGSACGCYYGYRCDKGGCKGSGSCYFKEEQVPIMEADEEARAIAAAKLAKATCDLAQWKEKTLPETTNLRQQIAPLKEKIEATNNLIVLIDKVRFDLDDFIQYMEKDKYNWYYNKLRFCIKLTELYCSMEGSLQDNLLCFLILTNKKFNMLDSFIEGLDNDSRDLIPLKLFGMEKPASHSRLEYLQFQLDLLNSDFYIKNKKMDSLRNQLTYLTVIESIDSEIARLKDDWCFMASPQSRIDTLQQLKTSINDAKGSSGMTYQKLIQSWLQQKTLSNFWQEETTVQELIHTGRSPLAFFSCQSKTRTAEFIEQLEVNYGNSFSPNF